MTTLRIKDSGPLKVMANLRMTISAGIHEEQGVPTHDQGPLSVIEVAAVNEFGGGRIPARKWLRGWTDSGQGVKNAVAAIRAAMLGAVRMQKFEQAPFDAVARDVMWGIRGRILSGMIRPVNAPATLARKAPETRPLLEHGQMADAIHGRLQASSPGGVNWKSEAR